MNSKQIYRAIGNADDALVERCEDRTSTVRRRQPAWVKWSAAAACLCLVLAGAFSIRQQGPVAVPGTGSVISSYEYGQSGSIYAPPENGEALFFPDVNAALDANAGDTYFVSVDIFQSGVPLDPESSDVQSELKRLTDSGYKVGYATYWTYQGEDMAKTDVPYLAGYFTADQLKTFAANEDYGYAFSFVSNGDGSAVSTDQELTSEIPG